MRDEETNGEGRTAKLIVGLLSAIGGMCGGILVAGMWLGTIRSDLNAHMTNPEIHMSRSQKEGIAQTVVDREVKPVLDANTHRLERIEQKLDALTQQLIDRRR